MSGGRAGAAQTTPARRTRSASASASASWWRGSASPGRDRDRGAIEGAIAGGEAADLLLVTDGKSHALDVQRLAAQGRRVSVLLVGEDSLEANVGHLAALTGGDLFVALEADMTQTLLSALASLRSPSRPAVVTEEGDRLRAVRRNALVEVEWRTHDAAAQAEDRAGRAVAALAASLRMTSLPEREAAELARDEGLVSHLTSLVLVDHAAEAQQGIPATRKVALPTPRVAGEDSQLGGAARDFFGGANHLRVERPFTAREERVLRHHQGAGSQADKTDSGEGRAATRERIRQIEVEALRKLKLPSRSRKLRSFLNQDMGGNAPSGPTIDIQHCKPFASPPSGRNARGAEGESWRSLVRASGAVDWRSAPNELAAGDLSVLGAPLVKDILRWSAAETVRAAAERWGIDPLLVVIGLLAWRNAEGDRAAARVARSILRGVGPDEVQGLLARLETPASSD
jgi:hypothetical protein